MANNMKNILFLLLLSTSALAQSPFYNDVVRANTLSPARVANALDVSKPLASTGTNTYTFSAPFTGFTYHTGDTYTLVFGNANNSTTVTANIAALGALAIKDASGSDLGVGDIKAGGAYKFYNNGTHLRLIGASGTGGAGGSSVNTLTPNIQTGNYTIQDTDTTRIIYMRHVTSSQVVTIPSGLKVGSVFVIVRDSTNTGNTVTIQGAAGVDVIGTLTLEPREAGVFHHRETNKYVRLGGGNAFWPLAGVADITAYTQITSTETGDPTHIAYIFADEGTIGFSGDFNSQTFSFSAGNNEAIFTDDRTNTVGLVYAQDYSAEFVNRSLVDKEYVDDAVAGAGGGGAIAAGAVGNAQYKSAGGGLQAEAAYSYDSATNTLHVDIVTVNDAAYNAGTWDGSLQVPTKNAVRDKIEAISPVDYSRQPLTVSGSTTAMDFNSLTYRNFDITATQSANFAITFSNATNLVESRLTMRITGTVIITIPVACVMQQYETINGRWDTVGNNLTLIGTTATPFLLTFYSDGTNVIVSASDPAE